MKAEKCPGGNRGEPNRRGCFNGWKDQTAPLPLCQRSDCSCHFRQRAGQGGDLVCLDCETRTVSWDERRIEQS